eukprot:SAG11_NODE_1554_length_4695_cov_1.527633_5_plen_54_part_01
MVSHVPALLTQIEYRWKCYRLQRGAGDSSSPKATASDDELNRPTDDEAAEATTR